MTAARSLALAPLLLTLTAAAGWTICKIAGVNPHVREMLLACGIGLIAAEIGLIPALIRRGKPDVAALFMAMLGGSVIHMGIVLFLGIVTMLIFRSSLSPLVYVGWLMAAYWPTLIGICVIFKLMLQVSVPDPKTEK
jgi:hypothetical protein